MKERGSYYSVIPASVRYDKSLTPIMKLLYGEITSLCNDKGFCWASNEYFGEIYDIKPKSISRAINKLKTREYITVSIDNTQYKNRKRKIFINAAKLDQTSLRFK